MINKGNDQVTHLLAIPYPDVRMKDRDTSWLLEFRYNISRWDKHGLNFWGIPKCGHTTVKYSLLNDKQARGTPPANDIYGSVHEESDYIKPDEALTNGNRNISFVRNPYERFLSMYKDFGLRRPESRMEFRDNPNIRLDKMSDLDYFIGIICSNKLKLQDQHFRSMSSYVTKNNQRLFDDIYDVAEMGRVLAELGVAMQVVNVTGDAKISLNDRQKQRVYEKYEQDFLVFGYAR